MQEEVYTVYRYDGHVFDMTLKEIFDQISFYRIGYGTDFGRYISTFCMGKRHNYSFSHPESKLRVYYEYLYFITNSNGKLMQPKQLINEYYQKYDPTNPSYTGIYRWRISTGKKRRGSSMYRGIRTTQELRACAGVLKEEGEPDFRGTRRNVPNRWDDICKSYYRSWKQCTKRRKQYKGS